MNRARQGLLGALFVFGAPPALAACSGAPPSEVPTETVVLPANEGAPVITPPSIDDGLVRRPKEARDAGRPGDPIAFRPWSLAVEDEARRTQKSLLVYVRADWCAACGEIERTTFASDDVRRAASAYLPVQIDVTEDTPSSNALIERFGVKGLPCIKVVRVEGSSASALAAGECLAEHILPDRLAELLEDAAR
jgi:thiol:disulfide interchange protein